MDLPRVIRLKCPLKYHRIPKGSCFAKNTGEFKGLLEELERPAGTEQIRKIRELTKLPRKVRQWKKMRLEYSRLTSVVRTSHQLGCFSARLGSQYFHCHSWRFSSGTSDKKPEGIGTSSQIDSRINGAYREDPGEQTKEDVRA